MVHLDAAYSADKVYMFSTYDQPQSKESMESLTSVVVAPNKKDKETSDVSPTPSARASSMPNVDRIDEQDEEDDEEMEEDEEDEDEDLEDGADMFDAFLDQVLGTNQADDGEEEDRQAAAVFSDVPVVHPRAYYAGTRNTATVKDGE